MRMFRLGLLLTTLSILPPSPASGYGEDLDVEDDAPLAGRDAIKPVKPDWCGNGYKRESSDDEPRRLIQRVERQLTSGFFGDQSLAIIGWAACEYPDSPEMQARVAKWRQRYINLSGLSDAQDREALKFRVANRNGNYGTELEGRWDAVREKYCESPHLKRTIDSPDTDDEQAISKREEGQIEPLVHATGCSYRGHGVFQRDSADIGPWLWWMDQRATPPSEVARAMYVMYCIDNDFGPEGFPRADDPHVMLAYATCGVDARRLDAQKLEDELKDPKYSEYARVHAREVFARAKAVNAHLEAAYRAKGQRDEAIKKLIFDAPEAAWAAWEKEYEEWKGAYEAMYAYEEKFYGNSKKAKRGCSEEIRGYLGKYAASRKATTPEAAQQIVTTPLGFTLASWVVACDVKEELWFDAMQEYERFQVRRIYRGPRTAAIWAVSDVLSEIYEDAESFPIKREWLWTPSSPVLGLVWNAWANEIGYGDEPAAGEIASLKKHAEGMLVTFKKVTVTEDVTECVDTKKVYGIDSSGRIIYYQKCKVVGTQKRTISPDPVVVPTHLAGDLKKGQFATFNIDTGRGEPRYQVRHGYPVEVWANAKKKKLVIWRGLSL